MGEQAFNNLDCRFAQVVVLASVAALAPEVNVSDKWHMLLLVV